MTEILSVNEFLSFITHLQKPDELDINKRNQYIYRYHLTYPKLSYAQIGIAFKRFDKKLNKYVPINAKHIEHIIRKEQQSAVR